MDVEVCPVKTLSVGGGQDVEEEVVLMLPQAGGGGEPTRMPSVCVGGAGVGIGQMDGGDGQRGGSREEEIVGVG